MKYLKKINEAMMCIVLVLFIFLLIKINFSKENHYDLNNDGQVDRLDKLILRKYIIENQDFRKESDKK